MKNDLTFKRTSLSTSVDVQNTLEFKMNSLQEDGIPIQEGLADYIGLSLDELDAQLLQLKKVKQELAEREKAIKSQSLYIKEEVPKFLEKYGIDKLVGNIVSSITLTKSKPKATKKVFVTKLTAKEKESLIYDAGLGHYEDVEVEEVTAKIKVNKRKIALSEVIEEKETE